MADASLQARYDKKGKLEALRKVIHEITRDTNSQEIKHIVDLIDEFEAFEKTELSILLNKKGRH